MVGTICRRRSKSPTLTTSVLGGGAGRSITSTPSGHRCHSSFGSGSVTLISIQKTSNAIYIISVCSAQMQGATPCCSQVVRWEVLMDMELQEKPLWGAKAIGDELGLSERKAFYLLERGLIPARK